MKAEKKMLLYGATGYTGKIIAERAKELNLDFDIPGRDKDKLLSLANKLNVGYHVFDVDDQEGKIAGTFDFKFRDNRIVFVTANLIH
ncbi:hypothetical protein SAMN04487995_0298 [Dyadobacter koreensis]|uniref:Saccharopine dehydrogenase NADP binding domain-containing protein n=1 Tax=Dyadobacter koreensis TaxID=408657 RepID=A0A1H6Q507_9BACT|nr:hypothetical protein [Dyadobacter koreensis]SEI38888.1 hypothetical protein SAMN04487995_0298 [Dyadobacter koreensis]